MNYELMEQLARQIETEMRMAEILNMMHCNALNNDTVSKVCFDEVLSKFVNKIFERNPLETTPRRYTREQLRYLNEGILGGKQ
jgi:hypothetical protein